MNNMQGKAILGSVIHTPTRDRIEFLKKALLLIDDEGKVIDLIKHGTAYYDEQVTRFKKLNSLSVIPSSQYLIPGFVDLHIHAPQWPQLGKALDVPLEVWLQKYTFPLEAKYEDDNFAMMVYSDLVASLLKNWNNNCSLLWHHSSKS